MNPRSLYRVIKCSFRRFRTRMSPFGPEQISKQTRRLPQRQVRRGGGGATGLGVSGGLLFGGVFVAVGTCITLAGLKIIPIDARKLHVPFPIFAMVGLVFLLPGLWVWFATFKSWLAERRRQQRFGLVEQDPALLDHPWDTRLWRTNRWAAARRAGFGAGFMTLFFTTVGGIVYTGRDVPMPLKIMVGVFVLITVWCVIVFLRELLRAFKYGSSAVGYDHFPLVLGETVNLRWTPPPRMLPVSSGQATLRCVREWTEVVGSGKNRTTKICHESTWESTRQVEAGTIFRPTDDIEISFTLPADQPGTCLSAAKITTFWELEIKLAVPGLDFTEGYLVPVYEA